MNIDPEWLLEAKSFDRSIDLRCEEILPSRSDSDELPSLESDNESLFSINCFRHFSVALKEKSKWNFATYIASREIGFRSSREEM